MALLPLGFQSPKGCHRRLYVYMEDTQHDPASLLLDKLKPVAETERSSGQGSSSTLIHVVMDHR